MANGQNDGEWGDRTSLEQDLLDKASNGEFRQRLIRDPRGTLQQTYGLDLPSDVTLHIHQEDANHLHFVLPMPDEMELSDEDLDSVAGGYDGSPLERERMCQLRAPSDNDGKSGGSFRRSG